MRITASDPLSASRPGGSYTPVVIQAGIAYVSGQLPRFNNELKFMGKVGTDLDIAVAREAARLCAIQSLAALAFALGNEDRLLRVLKVTGFVASAPGFTEQPKVIDAASEYFIEMMGEAGQHARSAIGVAELPHGAPVEVEIIAAVKP